MFQFDGKPIIADEAKKAIDQLLKADSKELGVFISMLAYEYIKGHNMTKDDFIKSLSNSLNILENKERQENNDNQ
ncbi:MAG: hypothetical protein ACI35S_07310 [Anaeroplasma sp.]